MRRRGFPQLERDHRVELPTGEVIHPDLGLPDDRFFVEVDHLTWHDGRFVRLRQAAGHQGRRAGYNIERVSDLAITNALAETVESGCGGTRFGEPNRRSAWTRLPRRGERS